MSDALDEMTRKVLACRICADRFAQTHTAHGPRPVTWFGPDARILIAGQAPGQRVHDSGRPFTDPSGDRLRTWMALGPEVFYDRSRIAILPMAFCFPGYNAKGADLPPPPVCARTWRAPLLALMPAIRLTLLIGGYAQKWHLGTARPVRDTVAGWRDHAPAVFPLPHPSWRNNAWLQKNTWFESDLLPSMRAEIGKALK